MGCDHENLVGFLVGKVWVAVATLDLRHCEVECLTLKRYLVRAECVEGQVHG